MHFINIGSAYYIRIQYFVKKKIIQNYKSRYLGLEMQFRCLLGEKVSDRKQLELLWSGSFFMLFYLAGDKIVFFLSEIIVKIYISVRRHLL